MLTGLKFSYLASPFMIINLGKDGNRNPKKGQYDKAIFLMKGKRISKKLSVVCRSSIRKDAKFQQVFKSCSFEFKKISSNSS